MKLFSNGDSDDDRVKRQAKKTKIALARKRDCRNDLSENKVVKQNWPLSAGCCTVK